MRKKYLLFREPLTKVRRCAVDMDGSDVQSLENISGKRFY